MRTRIQNEMNYRWRSGIALIIAMVSVLALTMMAGALATLVKIETKLAFNVDNESDLAWVARSGVEYARWLLAEQLRTNQWDEEELWQFELDLGNARFSGEIQDLERKININLADQRMLERALALAGANAADISVIVNSILDWIDRDNATRVSGAESDFYQRNRLPYQAKNGPIDDISELLMVRGVTPELFWGPVVSNRPGTPVLLPDTRAALFKGPATPTSTVGLVDVFTPLSTGLVNINTASAEVLQIVLGVDANTAARIVEFRNMGEGTLERKPIGAPGKGVREALLYAGFSFQGADQAARFFTVRGSTFLVRVRAERAGYGKSYCAVLLRNNPNDVRVLTFRAE